MHALTRWLCHKRLCAAVPGSPPRHLLTMSGVIMLTRWLCHFVKMALLRALARAAAHASQLSSLLGSPCAACHALCCLRAVSTSHFSVFISHVLCHAMQGTEAKAVAMAAKLPANMPLELRVAGMLHPNSKQRYQQARGLCLRLAGVGVGWGVNVILPCWAGVLPAPLAWLLFCACA